MIRSKSSDATHHRRTGYTTEKEKIQNCRIRRAPVVLLVFRDVNAYLLTRSCCEHRFLLQYQSLYDRSPRYHATPNGN
jgi:hypothetical protein